jgi:hypothetical protein
VCGASLKPTDGRVGRADDDAAPRSPSPDARTFPVPQQYCVWQTRTSQTRQHDAPRRPGRRWRRDRGTSRLYTPHTHSSRKWRNVVNETRGTSAKECELQRGTPPLLYQQHEKDCQGTGAEHVRPQKIPLGGAYLSPREKHKKCGGTELRNDRSAVTA